MNSVLKGSTWGHERGYGPLLALNEKHRDLFPYQVDWSIRSLKEFGDHSLVDLSNNYDLVIFDHPFIGEIAKKELLIPLNNYLDKAYLEDQKANAVGASYMSYEWDGNLYALPIDIAGHVSASRIDLFKKYNLEIPQTWNQVLDLAKETSYSKGSLVSIPGFSVDIWCFFVTLCANQNINPYEKENEVVPHEVGATVLKYIMDLSDLSPSDSYSWNPIELLDAMSSRDEFIYTPSLFGYSNYSKIGFRNSLIQFGQLPDAGFGSRGGILGGAGIGVSSKSKYPKESAKVAEILSSPAIQRDLYARYGGQPGHRGAWLSKENNDATNNFYLNTLETLDNSYLRPRIPGFVKVQTLSSEVLHDAVHRKISIIEALSQIDAIYQDSVKKSK